MSKSLQHLNSLIYWMTRLQAWGSRLHDVDIEESLESVSRKLLYSSLLFEHDTIAVTGLQGAGKTTLIQEIYGLDASVLQPNEGRGEKVPVLVRETESAVQRYCSQQFRLRNQGEDVDFVREMKELEPGQFLSMLKGNFVREDKIFNKLPVLEVPQKIRGNSFQFALLPGLEEENNEWWQGLMQHALTASGSCIFVCDETRLAHGENKRLIAEVLQRLEGVTPVIVVTQTEDWDDEHRSRVRETVKELFSLRNEEMDRVICSGTGAKYREHWFPELRNAIIKYCATSKTVQQRQLRHLDLLLKTEGIRTVRNVTSAVKAATEAEGLQQDKKLTTIVAAFDAKSTEFRKDLKGSLTEALERHRCRVNPDQSLEKDRPNVFQRCWSWIVDSERRRQMKFRDDILNAWKPKEFHYEFLGGLGSLVKRNLHILGASTASEGSHTPTVKDSLSALRISPSIQQNLEVIYAKRTDLEFTADENARKAVEVLPLLAVEWYRMTTEKPEYVGVSSGQLAEPSTGINFEAFRSDFGQWQDTYRYIFKAIAVSFGMEDSLDGKVESIPAALSLMGIAAPAATAVANALVVGGVLYSAVEAANRESSADYHRCELALDHMKQATQDRCLQAYDTLIEIQRRHLIQRLSDKLGINREFGARLNIEHASAQVKSHIDDFRSAIREDLRLIA